MQITVALAQMFIHLGRPERNRTTAQTLAAQAAIRTPTIAAARALGHRLRSGSGGRTRRPLDEGTLPGCLPWRRHTTCTSPARPSRPTRAVSPLTQQRSMGRMGAHWCLSQSPPVGSLGEVEHMTPGNALPAFDLPWAAPPWPSVMTCASPSCGALLPTPGTARPHSCRVAGAPHRALAAPPASACRGGPVLCGGLQPDRGRCRWGLWRSLGVVDPWRGWWSRVDPSQGYLSPLWTWTKWQTPAASCLSWPTDGRTSMDSSITSHARPGFWQEG